MRTARSTSGRGCPDFAAPQELKDAASQAIAEDYNQYPITWGWGVPRGDRREVRSTRMDGRSQTEICVTCGSTEAMIASMVGVLDPGDEVVIFEPFYENYGPTRSSPARRRSSSPCAHPTGRSTRPSCAAAFSDRTRAIVINTPNNPTGKVFTREELTLDRRAVRRARRHRDHRRDLRAHHLRRCRARADRHAARHGASARSRSARCRRRTRSPAGASAGRSPPG